MDPFLREAVEHRAVWRLRLWDKSCSTREPERWTILLWSSAEAAQARERLRTPS